MLKIQKKRIRVGVVTAAGVILSFFNSVDAAPKKKKIPIEIVYSFATVSSYLEKEDASTLFCVDVDRGLLQHPYLGSPGWYETRRRQLFKSFGNEPQGNERVEEEALVIDIFRKKDCLESNIPDQIEAIFMNSSAFTLGVSSSGVTAIPATLHSLLQQNINFERRSISSESHLLKIQSAPSEASLFYRGILFCGETIIVDALSQLFAQLNFSPKKMIFLGEDPEAIQAIGAACIGWGINFLGLVYYPAQKSLFSYAHPYSTAAELQGAEALQIISDEVAQLTLDALAKTN
ncbi:DUF2608 domain-containing protein [Candidatus Chlamydia corallus]|uniref:DUF2608 domain-containing protein n=1 Tax=Candidatus Chlamydia corallus TaxID=2038470 RepID=UPI000C2F9547|nr:DUF2608 domain-containing protein [Candidatus Chlamydia corallus]